MLFRNMFQCFGKMLLTINCWFTFFKIIFSDTVPQITNLKGQVLASQLLAHASNWPMPVTDLSCQYSHDSNLKKNFNL